MSIKKNFPIQHALVLIWKTIGSPSDNLVMESREQVQIKHQRKDHSRAMIKVQRLKVRQNQRKF
jgi:hypothetical protein